MHNLLLCRYSENSFSKKKQTENKSPKPLETVFFDFVGPITASGVDGFRYFVTFIDEYSSHACANFIRDKNQVCTLPTTVLQLYFGQTLTRSIRTKKIKKKLYQQQN